MADQNKVKFHEKILKYKTSRYMVDVESDVNINVIHFQDETHTLKYDQATRDTQSIMRAGTGLAASDCLQSLTTCAISLPQGNAC